MLSLLLAVSSCIYQFLARYHPYILLHFLLIFILVSLLFYPGLALTVARGEISRYNKYSYVYAHAYCARAVKRKSSENGVSLNGNRRGGPGSCFLKVRHYRTIQKAHHARK